MAIRSAGLAVLAALVLSSCGDDSGEDGAGLRVVHLSPDAPAVDIYVDDEIAAAGVEYLDDTGYFLVPAGVANVIVTLADDPDAVVIDTDATLTQDTDYTVLAANVAEEIEPIILRDDNSPPASGFFQLRIVHGAPSTGAVDVYVTTPGLSLEGRAPTVADLAFGSASPYLEVAAGAVQVRVTTANTLSVILDSGSATGVSGTIRTLIAADAVGGGGPLQWEVLNDLN